MYELAFEVARQRDYVDRLNEVQERLAPQQADLARQDWGLASDDRPVAPAVQLARFLTRLEGSKATAWRRFQLALQSWEHDYQGRDWWDPESKFGQKGGHTTQTPGRGAPVHGGGGARPTT